MLSNKNIEIFAKLLSSKDLATLTQSPQFQVFTKEIKDLLNNMVDKDQPEAVEPLSVLIGKYRNLIFSKFKHKAKGTEYVLIELTNTESDDQEKFPTTAVYHDVVKGVKWSRPLVEFDQNFKQI